MCEMWGAYGTKRNSYRILIRKPEVKRPFGKPRRRSKGNIKIIVNVMEGVDCSNTA
jgi:hypothetical protein